MRIFISVDIEGVAGIVHPHQGRMGEVDYERCRRLMTQEANAAIEGALQAGAQEIVVNDSHAEARNLVAEELNPAAELISGYPKALYMCQGMGPGFEAAFFVGYHGGAGARDAVIDHTYSSKVAREVRLNGVRQTEGSLNGQVCGYFGCPVALFTGDAAAVSEMHEFVTEVEGVVVKESMGRYVARSLHPEVARDRIRTGARRAIERLDNIPPLRIEGLVEMEIDVHDTAMADVGELVPGVRRLAGRTLAFAHEDYLEVFRCMLVLLALGQTVILR